MALLALSLCGHWAFFPSSLGYADEAEVKLLSLLWQSNAELSVELSRLCACWWWKLVGALQWHLATTLSTYSDDDKPALWMYCANNLKRMQSLSPGKLYGIGHCILSFFCCYIMNMHMAVCVCWCVCVCVVVCELSQTPPDLCLRRLISAVHKGALCASQDRLSGQWIHCLTTPSPSQANWYAPLSPEIIGSSVFLH